MIDPQVFSGMMKDLCEYFDRRLPDSVAKVWFKHLNAHLNNEQLQQAFDATIAQCQFMPTPAEFVALVRGSDEQLAAEEWELCLKGAARGQFDYITPPSETGMKALEAIGGLHKLGLTDENRLPFLRKDFLDAWKQYRKVPEPAPNPDRAIEGRRSNGLTGLGGLLPSSGNGRAN